MLSPKCILLLEQLTREMNSEETFFAMAIVEGDANPSYAGNVPYDIGAELMRQWLDCEDDGCNVDVRHVGEMFAGLAN